MILHTLTIMGQQEVYNFLKQNKNKWFTSKQISESIGVSIGSVTMSLKKLRKSQLVKYKNTGKRNEFKYMFKP
jgi:Mn-dependent DtxR family transcriptional regulator